MGQNALTNIADALYKKEDYLGEMLSNPGKEPILAIINSATKTTNTGQNLREHFKVKIRPSGGWGLTTEGGDYAAAQPMSADEGYQVPRLINHSLEYTVHALAAMNHQTPGQVGETVAKDVASFLATARRRKARLFTGRGDMVLGRASAANTSATFTSTTDVPIRAVQGDYVTMFKATTSGEERLYQDEDTGTAYVGTTHRFVNDVDYDANTVTFDASTGIWGTHSIMVPDGCTSSNKTGPQGMEALYDTVNDASFAWDGDDAASVDHVDTIYTLVRSTLSQLNVNTVNTSGYLTLDKIQRGVGKCVGKGGSPSDLALICHPKQFEALTQSNFSKVGEWKTMTMAGQDLDLFCVTGLGSAQIPVICDYGIKESAVLLIDRSKLYSIELPGGWDRDEGGMFQKKNAATGAGHAAAKIAYWNMWLNWYSVFPNTSCIIYGLSS